MNKKLLEDLAEEHGTPLLVIDHAQIKRNYHSFIKHLPRVQAYYAIKANSEPEVVKTMFNLGASFDVASLSEFQLVLDIAEHLLPGDMQNFIWNNIIYANTMKQLHTLHQLNPYSPLVTYDSPGELEKIKLHCPAAGLILRLEVPDEGSIVSLKDKFGVEIKNAIPLIEETYKKGLHVEGLSFHVGSQCINFKNYIDALDICAGIFKEAEKKGIEIGEKVTHGFPIKQLDIGGGFPARYEGDEPPFVSLAGKLNKKFELFPEKEYAILAEPGRFIVANSAAVVMRIIGKTTKRGKIRYHADDGLYHTFSGVMFDHQKPVIKSFKEGKEESCAVFGPTCDSLDKITDDAHLPNNLKEGDLLYAENMGAYTNASSTWFNGFSPAKILHINNSKFR